MQLLHSALVPRFKIKKHQEKSLQFQTLEDLPTQSEGEVPLAAFLDMQSQAGFSNLHGFACTTAANRATREAARFFHFRHVWIMSLRVVASLRRIPWPEMNIRTSTLVKLTGMEHFSTEEHNGLTIRVTALHYMEGENHPIIIVIF